MSTAGRMLAGAIKGVSKFGLDQLELRQEEDSSIRKAKMLEDLRKDTAKELAVFEEGMLLKRADKNFSGVEGNEYVIRDGEGNKKSTRALSPEDIRELELKRTKAEQDVAKGSLDMDNTRSMMASRNREDARQERYTSASIANMGKKGGSLDGSDSDVSENSLAQGMVNRYKDFAGEMDPQVVYELALESIETAARTSGANTKTAEDIYLRLLKQRKAFGKNAAEGAGSRKPIIID